MPAELYDLTVKVNGHGFELIVTRGGMREKPTAVDQEHAKASAEENFAFWFGCEHETSAVTVGPHRPECDGDREVG